MATTDVEAQQQYRKMKDYFKKKLSEKQFTKPKADKNSGLVEKISKWLRGRKWDKMMKTKNAYDKSLEKGLRKDVEGDKWREISKQFK